MNKAQIKVELNELLTIDNVVYHVAEHPALPGVPYVQRGARGFVIQLQAPNKDRFALKYFKIKYRVPELAAVGKALRQYANLPGLHAANRVVFTMQSHPGLVRKYPPLEYGTLMPWIPGMTWFDVIVRRVPLTPRESLQLATTAATVLASLEANNLAHCDIAGANVMVERAAGKVELVDIEEMHGANLPHPVELPAGQEGYQHRASVQNGQWTADGDRFGGAVLIAEMLGWQSAQIRENSADEHYFSALEMQQPDSARYKLLHNVIRTEYSPNLADQFEAVWHSATLRDCPPLTVWRDLLLKRDPSAVSNIAPGPVNTSAAPIISGRRPLLTPSAAPAAPPMPTLSAPPDSAAATQVSMPTQPMAVPVSASAAVKLCPNCGTANPLNAEFCQNCNYHLKRDQRRAAPDVAAASKPNNTRKAAVSGSNSASLSVTPAPAGAPPLISARRMVSPGQPGHSGQTVSTPEPPDMINMRYVVIAVLIAVVLVVILLALGAH